MKTVEYFTCKMHYLIDNAIALAIPNKPPIIMNGFWRSGTTWAQQVFANAINAKTIFEPLDPSALIPLYKRKWGQDLNDCLSAFIPLSVDDLDSSDRHFLKSAFAGMSPKRSCFMYLCREGLNEAFRKQVVIKFVRAHYLLDYLAEQYSAKPVHISRHPCAVVTSLLNTSWKWNFAQLDFKNIYTDTTAASTNEDRLALVGTSNAPSHVKIATLWALTERKAFQSNHTMHVKYEDLMNEPEKHFTKIAQYAQTPIVNSINTSADSPVTEVNRHGINTQDRLFSWKKKMPAAMRKDVKNTLLDIWPEADSQWEL